MSATHPTTFADLRRSITLPGVLCGGAIVLILGLVLHTCSPSPKPQYIIRHFAKLDTIPGEPVHDTVKARPIVIRIEDSTRAQNAIRERDSLQNIVADLTTKYDVLDSIARSLSMTRSWSINTIDSNGTRIWIECEQVLRSIMYNIQPQPKIRAVTFSDTSSVPPAAREKPDLVIIPSISTGFDLTGSHRVVLGISIGPPVIHINF